MLEASEGCVYHIDRTHGKCIEQTNLAKGAACLLCSQELTAAW
jgi:hypothetical protein